jgi:hypothetical protein
LTVPYRKYSLYEASVQDWSEILALAERWTFPEVKALCVRELEKLTILDVDRIVLYNQYHVDQNLLIPCYAALISREYPLTLDEGVRLGMEIALNIGRARECARANPTSDGIRSPTPCALGSKEVEAIVKEQFKIEAPPAPEPAKPGKLSPYFIADRYLKPCQRRTGYICSQQTSKPTVRRTKIPPTPSSSQMAPQNYHSQLLRTRRRRRRRRRRIRRIRRAIKRNK